MCPSSGAVAGPPPVLSIAGAAGAVVIRRAMAPAQRRKAVAKAAPRAAATAGAMPRAEAMMAVLPPGPPPKGAKPGRVAKGANADLKAVLRAKVGKDVGAATAVAAGALVAKVARLPGLHPLLGPRPANSFVAYFIE